MPDLQTGSQSRRAEDKGLNPAVKPGCTADTLRIARRMRQLTIEVRIALDRNNLALAKQASALLAPTLAQWQALQPAGAPVSPEIAQLAQEARRQLDECVEELVLRMSRVANEIQRLRKSRQTLARLRPNRSLSASRYLDSRY